MFRGRSDHALDAKGRIAIPSRFRQVLENRGGDTLVITNHGDCLWAFLQEDWSVLEEKASHLPLFRPEVLTYMRYFISGAVECQVKQGRITVPPDLRKVAELDTEVTLVGGLKRFEIWRKDKWEEEFLRTKDDFHSASKLLPDLVI